MTGFEISDQTPPRPVLIAVPTAFRSAELARSLELSGVPTVMTCDPKMLAFWQHLSAAAVAVFDLSMECAIDLGHDFSRNGVRIIGISSDEVLKMKALRLGFLEVIEDTIGGREFALRVSALLREPIEPLNGSADALEPLRLNAGRRVAFWRDAELHLSKQPFDLLAYLTDRADVIVPKDQIKNAFQWADDNTLHQAVWHLKTSLGAEASRHIVNRHGYGYGYLVEVVDADLLKSVDARQTQAS